MGIIYIMEPSHVLRHSNSLLTLQWKINHTRPNTFSLSVQKARINGTQNSYSKSMWPVLCSSPTSKSARASDEKKPLASKSTLSTALQIPNSVESKTGFRLDRHDLLK